MRDSWYGDSRDIVKWSAVLHLASRERLSTILHVAMFRADRRPTLQSASETISVPDAVWTHFRNLPAVCAVGAQMGVTIRVLDDPFDARNRRSYFEAVATVVAESGASKAVLLDPDTGIAPASATAEHVTVSDVETVWNALRAGDWLLLYQHRWRNKEWLAIAESKFMTACRVPRVDVFRAEGQPSDVAMFAAQTTAEAR
jgi:hypothetical protein